VIARELQRPVDSVLRMAHALFPADVKKSGPWGANEVLQLKRYLGATTPETIARILGRTVAEVQEQIIGLGRLQRGGTWTRAEIGEFKRIYGRRTDEDLERIFGRPAQEIQRVASEHGLSKDKAFVRMLRGDLATTMPRWTDAELELLRECYPQQSNLEIARRLGRSVKSVVSKAQHEGLKKSPERLKKMGRENVRVRYTPD
jgi:DNA-directed RNA polymerase specialized sigma24 family protein